MKKSILWLVFGFWIVFGIGCYWYVLPNQNPVLHLNISILFWIAIVYTTQVVFGLLTKKEKYLVTACFLGLFLLNIWYMPSLIEKEPLIGVLGLIFSISILWEKRYARWRVILNVLISIVGLIGVLRMQKAGFVAWNLMASIAVSAVWAIYFIELLCYWLKLAFLALKKAFLKTKEETERAVADGTAFVAGQVTKGWSSLTAIANGGIEIVQRCCRGITAFFSRRKKAFVKWKNEDALPFLGENWDVLVEWFSGNKKRFTEWLPIFLGKWRVKLKTAQQWVITKHRKYYPPLKKWVISFCHEAISKFKKEKFL